MEGRFEHKLQVLRETLNGYSREQLEHVPSTFQESFFSIVSTVSWHLMEEKDQFYSYFLFQMTREIRFDIASPTAVQFKGAKYVLYLNPFVFLNLTLKQMMSTIKHEIHHILALHLIRAKDLKKNYSTLALNMAMDLVANQYLGDLPPYAITLAQVNVKYQLALLPYETFEYYAEKLQIALDLQEVDDEGDVNDAQEGEKIEKQFDAEKTHDLWEASDLIEDEALSELTKKFIEEANKGEVPIYLNEMLGSLQKSKEELPWHIYLHRLMGTLESHYKKTMTRRNRRQPERLDLSGHLRGHKAEVAVALDISGSMSEEMFHQAMKEVLGILRNYPHAITLIECDHEIRRTYKVRHMKDLKERMHKSGGTQFTPVFDYANKNKIDLLIYFTDGKGESVLQVTPKNYKVLWVLSGQSEALSLKKTYGIVKKLHQVEVKDRTLEMRDVRSDGYSMNHQEPIF